MFDIISIQPFQGCCYNCIFKFFGLHPELLLFNPIGIDAFSLYSLLHLRLTVMFNSNSIAERLRDGSDSPQRSED